MEDTLKTAAQRISLGEEISSVENAGKGGTAQDAQNEFIGLQLNIRCEHYRRLQAAATAQGISIGELIERMIDTWRAIAQDRT